MSNLYFNLSIEEMVLYGLSLVLEKKKQCSFGILVEQCFKLYPSTFALTDVSRWPDSLKLDRPLRNLREKGYITGSPTTYYSITNFGYKILNTLSMKIQNKSSNYKAKLTRSPDLLRLQEIKKSEDFVRYLNDKKNFTPNNMRIRELTKFTLETPRRTVVNYVSYLEKIAKKNKLDDLHNYLEIYEHFLTIRKI